MQIEKLWRQSINYTQRLHNLVQRPRHQLFPSVYDRRESWSKYIYGVTVHCSIAIIYLRGFLAGTLDSCSKQNIYSLRVMLQRDRKQAYHTCRLLLDLVRHTSQNSNFHISALLYQVIVVHT